MTVDIAANVWAAYQRAEINRSTHPNDKMSVKGAAWYYPVGASAALSVFESLVASPTQEVRTVLDFGCGYGRVARHIRPMFPNATFYFSDNERDAIEFCAGQFDGTAVPSATDLADLSLPPDMDLIWVGSVFTHLDYGRMAILFAKLFDALGTNGTLIITTHGTRCLEMAAAYPYIGQDRWERIVSSYTSTGVGFEPYAGDPNEWGVSLMTPGKVWELASAHPKARMIHFKEAGWADHQDVAAFCKLP
jgi:SAM-dependent methyltransferase